MFIGLNKIKLKDDFDRIVAFFILHSILFLCAKFYEYIRYEFTVLSFIGLCLWLVYYKFFYRMLRFLYYSFWTGLTVSVIVIFSDMYSSIQKYDDVSLFYFYAISLFSLIASAVSLYSPIYYPVVSWWEYDFRYRNDIKTIIKFEDHNEEARLVDLRKGAGGLTFFGDLNTGDIVTLSPKLKDVDLEVKAEVVSKRQRSLGRPLIYGIKFVFNSDEEKKNFVKFQNFWQFERKHKQQEKFKDVK